MSVLGCCLTVSALAQVQIITKKEKISDFPQNILKVILPGNPLDAAAFEQEITSGWRLSPYEFCSYKDFENYKSSPDFYFLSLVNMRFPNENTVGTEFITIVKGGEGADGGLGSMLEVCAFPFRSAKGSEGREYEYLPAMMDIIQDYIEDSMGNDVDAYAGFVKYAGKLSRIRGMRVLVAESDLSKAVDAKLRAKAEAVGIEFVSEDDASDAMESRLENTLVSYTVHPVDAGKGSYCFKMLFGADDHRLYYFRKQRVSSPGDCGFTPLEIKKMVSILKK